MCALNFDPSPRYFEYLGSIEVYKVKFVARLIVEGDHPFSLDACIIEDNSHNPRPYYIKFVSKGGLINVDIGDVDDFVIGMVREINRAIPHAENYRKKELRSVRKFISRIV